MTSGPPGAPSAERRLVVRTVPLEAAEVDVLVDLLPREQPLAWLRRGDGLVGWGEAAAVRTSGATRFADADKWWSETTARADVDDAVGEHGSGLVAFGSFAFADEPGDSLLVVPRLLVGRRGDRAWLTTVSEQDAGGGPAPCTSPRPTAAPRPARGVTFADGARNGEEWMSVVADAVAGSAPATWRRSSWPATWWPPRASRSTCAGRCAAWPSSYPMCWTFHVDGLFGATPEMLVRRERGLVTSRVLAGTIRRTGDDDRDLALAGHLARSSKDLEEHEYAVRSVADALEPYCSSMNVPEAPFVLHLPNVMHLATDVAGVVHDAGGVSSLRLAESLHPSAAVGGTPTDVATGVITEIEGMDRGRYAGPVGWMDASGDGEWGLALRSASLEGAACGSSPAAGSWRRRPRRPSWPSPRPSSSRSATRSAPEPASEVLAVGAAQVLLPGVGQEHVHLRLEEPVPGLGVDPVVDRQVARRAHVAGQLDGVGQRSHGAELGTSSTSTGTSGRVSASPGWKTVCSAVTR